MNGAAAIRSGARRDADWTALRARLEALCRAGAPATERRSSGFAALDEATGGGFFEGALNELIPTHAASGFLEALGRALQPSAAGSGRLGFWVDPLRLPYPPALRRLGLDLDRWIFIRPADRNDQLWAIEQILDSGLCSTLVTGLDRIGSTPLRRLQLAAGRGRSLALLLRSPQSLEESSPAAMRLVLRPLPSRTPGRRRLAIDVVKCRDRAFAGAMEIEWNGPSRRDRLAPRRLQLAP